MLYPNEVIINAANYKQYAQVQVVDGERKARGLIPRNYSTHPTGTYHGETPYDAVAMPIIADAQERRDRLKDQLDGKFRLSDYCRRGNAGKPIPARDQNGRGYCWAHSGTGALIAIRARDNMPYVSLSAYAVACIIKNYRDEGGWGAQGLDFIMERGVPDEKFWPQRGVRKEFDTPETWANAANYKVTEGWIDASQAQYDRQLTFDQTITCLLLGIPVIADFSWWSHSVCLLDAVDGQSQRKVTRSEASGKLLTLKAFEEFWGFSTVAAGWGVRLWNSWGSSWSDGGMGVLTGQQAVPDGATAPRVAIAA